MAYVVARPGHRFELRESVHTPEGPRARSLASFRVLSASVLAKARARAIRPFSDEEVMASARRVGAHVEVDWDAERWVAASRRMARVLDRPAATGRPDPGASLLELLDFADAVATSVGPRKWEPLAFPVLSRMAERAD